MPRSHVAIPACLAGILTMTVVPVGRTSAAGATPPHLPGHLSSRCDRVDDVTFDDDTDFPYEVGFSIGRDDLEDNDTIVLEEVVGTTSEFEVGGIYRVRGTYTLSSRDSAVLSFTITASERGRGCTRGNRRGRVRVQRGTGTFDLATPIPYAGYPHIWFRVDDDSVGGRYFGEGAFLRE